MQETLGLISREKILLPTVWKVNWRTGQARVRESKQIWNGLDYAQEMDQSEDAEEDSEQEMMTKGRWENKGEE